MTNVAGPPVVVAVIVHGGRVLLIRRRVGEPGLLWSFPGGKVESGETASAAAVREVFEETGLTVIARRMLGKRVHPVTGRAMTYIACNAVAGRAHASAPGEVAEVAWCGTGQLRERVPSGIFRPVQHYLDSMMTL